MQAFGVSKRPPRALFIVVAIALGMVAVSPVVLSNLGGGLARDGTYLRLLGYRPSNSGATLAALSADDASQGRVVCPLPPPPGPRRLPPPPRSRRRDRWTRPRIRRWPRRANPSGTRTPSARMSPRCGN